MSSSDHILGLCTAHFGRSLRSNGLHRIRLLGVASQYITPERPIERCFCVFYKYRNLEIDWKGNDLQTKELKHQCYVFLDQSAGP
jgi:hypothetical protein